MQQQHRRLQPLLPPPPSLTLARSSRPSTVQGDRGPPCTGGTERGHGFLVGTDTVRCIPRGSSWHSPSTGMLHPLHHSHTPPQHNPSVLGETEAQSGGERGKQDRPTDPKPSPPGASSTSQPVKLAQNPRSPEPHESWDPPLPPLPSMPPPPQTFSVPAAARGAAVPVPAPVRLQFSTIPAPGGVKQSMLLTPAEPPATLPSSRPSSRGVPQSASPAPDQGVHSTWGGN